MKNRKNKRSASKEREWPEGPVTSPVRARRFVTSIDLTNDSDDQAGSNFRGGQIDMRGRGVCLCPGGDIQSTLSKPLSSFQF